MQRLTENWKGATAKSAVRAVASTNGGLGTWEQDLPRILKWGLKFFCKKWGFDFFLVLILLQYCEVSCHVCTDNKVACNGAGVACLIFALNSFIIKYT